jgi:hypothetical protein
MMSGRAYDVWQNEHDMIQHQNIAQLLVSAIHSIVPPSIIIDKK